MLEAVFRFLSKHQYQLTIDRAAQQEHAKRGGFCSLHTWQYENISSPYGVCASYPALVHRLASELQALAGDMDGPIGTFESISNLGASQGTCQVCQVRIEAERNAVHEAADRIRKITNSRVGNMPACCLVHLAMTTSVLGRGRTGAVIVRSPRPVSRTPWGRCATLRTSPRRASPVSNQRRGAACVAASVTDARRPS